VVFDYSAAVGYLLLIAMCFLSITIFFCLFFAVRGQRLTDKIIATNMIAVKTIILVVMVGIYFAEGYLIDVAMVFALISFLATVTFTRLILQFMFHKSNTRSRPDDADSAM